MIVHVSLIIVHFSLFVLQTFTHHFGKFQLLFIHLINDFESNAAICLINEEMCKHQYDITKGQG